MHMLRHLRRVWLSLLLLGQPAWAVDDFFTFTFENDLFVGRDYGYTAGMQLAWARGPARHYEDITPRWIAAMAEPLWLSHAPENKLAVSYKLGGAMFTPKDLKAIVPPADDMPYSGMVFWEGALHSFNDRVADKAYLILGMVGPDSGVSSIQDAVHEGTGSVMPQGWDSQLANEPVFKIGVGRKWRSKAWEENGSPWGVDLITFTELGAGTLDSNLDAGLTLRWGRNLLLSFPTAGPLPGREINPLAGAPEVDFNMFLSVMGRYMPNAVYIEGNNFGGKRSGITLKQEQLYVAGGVQWNVGNWGFLYSVAYSSDWFDEADGKQLFGSLSVTYRY